jgi:hypothetical protein
MNSLPDKAGFEEPIQSIGFKEEEVLRQVNLREITEQTALYG